MRCFLWSVIAGVYHGAAKPGSCVGKCGEWDEDCWCNDACEEYGNCCLDYEEQCGRKTCEKCGKWSCDEWISWDPAKNSCESMLKDWGCTCKGCHCGHGTETSLVILSEEQYPEARCLDGTMAGYYVRKGISEQMLVFLEGGGWCYDQSCSPTDEGTLTDCQKRSYKNLGSSKSWEKILPERKLTGMLSADPKANSVFHNWTLVYVPYCDGTSFSGDAVVSFKGRDLHFKGRKILDGVFQSLRLDVTKQLVVSGGSAGALAVLLHIDSIAQEVTRSHGDIEIFGLADAGFFLDLPNMKGVRCWPNQMRSIFNISNGYKSLSSTCLKRNSFQPSDCIFPQYFGDLIETRTFLAHSFYDDSEMYYTLGLDCWPGGGRGQRACNKKEMRAFDNLRMQHMSGWSRMLNEQARAHCVWAPACIAHTLTWGQWTDPLWQVPEGGAALAETVQLWLGAKETVRLEDPASWPNNRPCAGMDDEPSLTSAPGYTNSRGDRRSRGEVHRDTGHAGHGRAKNQDLGCAGAHHCVSVYRSPHSLRGAGCDKAAKLPRH